MLPPSAAQWNSKELKHQSSYCKIIIYSNVSVEKLCFSLCCKGKFYILYKTACKTLGVTFTNLQDETPVEAEAHRQSLLKEYKCVLVGRYKTWTWFPVDVRLV